ncbi:MAG TPA: outer membrane protein assembly factor BamD [Bauldia sp.]|nr:outer membrane protein assembly factor BamD [Bauldia sp.]
MQAGGRWYRPVAGTRWRAVALAGVLAAAFAAAGCSHSVVGTKDAYEPDEPAGNLYNRGLGYMNAGKYKDAIKEFNELDRQHPYSESARKALILAAYTSFQRGMYPETIATANRYLTLYPGSPDAAYAQYLLGRSYFAQIPDVTRDQAKTQQAMQAMQDLIDHYPDSEYVDDAQKKILITRDQLAGKEMQVGRYYLERREYTAAINRFRTVVTDYQSTRHVEEALERLVEANLSLGLINEAQTAAAVLGHNYPDSRWYKDAYNLLRRKGAAPLDNGGVVSEAFKNKKTG